MMRLSIAQSKLKKLQNKNEQLMNEETVLTILGMKMMMVIFQKEQKKE